MPVASRSQKQAVQAGLGGRALSHAVELGAEDQSQNVCHTWPCPLLPSGEGSRGSSKDSSSLLSLHADRLFQQELKQPVDQFMDSLTSEQPYWRANFGITDTPALFQVTYLPPT